MSDKAAFLVAAIAPATRLISRLAGQRTQGEVGAREHVGRATRSSEADRRVLLLQRLYREHAIETSGRDGEITYRATLPPQSWMNDRLSALGLNWRVHNVDGFRYEVFDIS